VEQKCKYNQLLPATVGKFQLNGSAKNKGRMLIFRRKSLVYHKT